MSATVTPLSKEKTGFITTAAVALHAFLVADCLGEFDMQRRLAGKEDSGESLAKKEDRLSVGRNKLFYVGQTGMQELCNPKR